MKNYYFTFGLDHVNIYGEHMCHHWVRVRASSYIKAREIFMEQWTSKFMESPSKFGFQYSDKNFEPSYYSRGEYALLTEKDEIDV